MTPISKQFRNSNSLSRQNRVEIPRERPESGDRNSTPRSSVRPPIPRIESPSPMHHSLFNSDLIRRVEQWWGEGNEGDPWPQAPSLRSIWEGAVPALRETGEGWIAGVSEYFSGPEVADVAACESSAPIPSVDEVLSYHRSFEKLEDGPERELLWRQAIARLRAEGHPHLPDENETYVSFRARLDALGPHLADRIVSLRSALTLLHHHDSLGHETASLPVAVVIGPAADHNGAFTSFNGYPMLDTLIDSGRFHVLYFESASESDDREALLRAHEGTARRLHTVVLAGHGLRTAMALSGPDPVTGSLFDREEEFLDINDFRSGDLGDLNNMMEPDGQVLMWSCSNGEGGAGTLNMANGMAEYVPGRSVYSTPIPSNIASLSIREDLSLNITWRETDGYIASFHEGDASVLRPETNESQEAFVISHASNNNAGVSHDS